VRALAWARVPAWACRLGAGRPVGPAVGVLASGKDSFGKLDLGSDGGSLLLLDPLGLGVRLLYGRMLSCEPVPCVPRSKA
jgi:hypothetical protein